METLQRNSNNIKKLCEFIWYLEEKYDLFALEVQDVYIWEYVRVQVYYKLAVALGILSPQTKVISKTDRIKIFLKNFKNIFTNNFWTLKHFDLVFFSHPRSVLVDGVYIDIYTEYIIKELSGNQTIIDFESGHQGRHVRQRKHNVHIVDWVKQIVYFKYFFKRKKKVLQPREVKLIKSIENEIFTHYGVELSLQKFLEQKIKLFKLYFNIYVKIFEKVSPSCIYCVVAYYMAPIVKAAKKNNIEVKELQHGIITKYHLGYSFPFLKKTLNYFPNKMIVWDTSWKNIVDYPISNENILVDKFRYLETKKNQFKNIKREKGCYLIISQTAISESIAKKILDNISFFKNKKIIYKLHPGEYNIWQKNKSLNKLKELLNVEVVTNEKNLYCLMAISEYQVGVFSTALYEGVIFGCKSILLDVDGIEYMEDFINVNTPLILR